MRLLFELRNEPYFEVKKEMSGSLRVSPRVRILSVSNGEPVEIIKVSGD